MLQAAQADPQFLQLVAHWEQAVERVEGLLDKAHPHSRVIQGEMRRPAACRSRRAGRPLPANLALPCLHLVGLRSCHFFLFREGCRRGPGAGNV